MAIRYDKKLNQEINRVIRNYNQKINRISKYEDSFNYQLPEKIGAKDLKQNVYTRSELKRKLNELKRFSIRGAEKSMQLEGGYVLSKYEYDNLRREKARVTRNVSREIKRLETEKPTVFGKQQARTFAQMGDSYYLNLLAKRKSLNKEIEKLQNDEFTRFEQLIYKTGRSQEYQNSLFRENYIKMLTDLAYYTNYDKERLNLDKEQIEKLNITNKKIIKKLDLQTDEFGNVSVNKIKYLESKLDKLNNRQFYRLFQNEKAIKSITEYYLLTTGKNIKKIDPSLYKDDVATLYDNLIENIDDIIGSL